MSQSTANQLPFEGLRHRDDAGDFWLARELAPVLEYSTWRNFENVIKKAIKACEASDQQVSDHFVDIDKVITTGKGAQQHLTDYRLSRYACYLIAQNGDPEKPIIALAQTYFAVQTRRQELADAGMLDDPERAYQDWHARAVRSFVAQGYSEEWARMRVDGITIRNQLTAEWAVRGISSKEMAILSDELHMGEFGISSEEHKDFKGFPVVRKGKRLVHVGELRPAMTVMEIAVTQVGEIMSRALHIARNSQGMPAIRRDVGHAGQFAGERRKELIAATGEPIPSPTNALPASNDLWAQLPEKTASPEGEA